MKISKQTIGKISNGLLYVFFAYMLTCLAVKGVYTYLQPLTPAQVEAKKQAEVNQQAKDHFEEYQKNKEEFLEYKQDQQLFQEYEKKREDFESYRKWKGQNSPYMSQPKFADLSPEIEPQSVDDDSIEWIIETYCHLPRCGTQMDPCLTVNNYIICDDA